MDLLEKSKKSYITKDELINIINNSHFEYVKSCELYTITDFIEKEDKEGKKYIDTLGFEIKIY